MFTNRIASYYSQDKVLIEAACLSTDTKPTTGVANGSKCIEMDTGKTYMFNEEDSEWEELPSSGGGGSSDFSTAEITLNDGSNEVTIYGAFTFENLQMPPANGTRSSNRFSNTVVLYKGSAIIELDGVPEGYSVSTSGDISQLGGRGYAITGDCTITIS